MPTLDEAREAFEANKDYKSARDYAIAAITYELDDMIPPIKCVLIIAELEPYLKGSQ